MASYLETTINGKTLMVAVTEDVATNEDGFRGGRPVPFEAILDTVKGTAKYVVDTLADLGTQEIELSYGLKLGFKAGISFWALAETSSESQFGIKILWKKDKP